MTFLTTGKMLGKGYLIMAIHAVVTISALGAETLPEIDLKPAFPKLKFNRPLWMEEIPDGSKRVIVIEQDGKVHVFPKDASVSQTKAFVDISARKPHEIGRAHV